MRKCSHDSHSNRFIKAEFFVEKWPEWHFKRVARQKTCSHLRPLIASRTRNHSSDMCLARENDTKTFRIVGSEGILSAIFWKEKPIADVECLIEEPEAELAEFREKSAIPWASECRRPFRVCFHVKSNDGSSVGQQARYNSQIGGPLAILFRRIALKIVDINCEYRVWIDVCRKANSTHNKIEPMPFKSQSEASTVDRTWLRGINRLITDYTGISTRAMKAHNSILMSRHRAATLPVCQVLRSPARYSTSAAHAPP